VRPIGGRSNPQGCPMWSVQLFKPGRVMTTPGVLAVLDRLDGLARALVIVGLLVRHVTGDWGELDPEDRAANDHAILLGERILSAYRLPDGTKVWVITEADRSATTVLLPSEY
jgi:hypothetical protein